MQEEHDAECGNKQQQGNPVYNALLCQLKDGHGNDGAHSNTNAVEGVFYNRIVCKVGEECCQCENDNNGWGNDMHIIIIEAIVAVIVLGVFAGWLQVQFPWGLFENFM